MSSANESRAECNPIERHLDMVFDNTTPQPRPGAAPLKQPSAADADASARQIATQTAAADAPGEHDLYLLVRKSDGGLPVVEAFGEEGASTPALMVFAHRESALLYLQISDTYDYRVETMTPGEFRQMIGNIRAEGVTALLIDPNRRLQEDGQPTGAIVPLDRIPPDASGEELYQEIFEAAGR